MAHEQSLLLLSGPGVGKSEIVMEAAREAGLPCRSLLGTQIAPEDVSGVPRIVGERSVFCPPRVLLPEPAEPFCLFLDELPACAPDVQKAFYSLLLERRLGEFPLPQGSWVVAAGNRIEDRALVRSLSSALINRVFILHVRADHQEWVRWAVAQGIRADILSFLQFLPEALTRPAPVTPGPFSTPRAWAQLSRALDLAEGAGAFTTAVRRALAFGKVSAEDAALFSVMAEERLADVTLLPLASYLEDAGRLPASPTARWFVLQRIRRAVVTGQLTGVPPAQLNRFLADLPLEQRFCLFIHLVEAWGGLGADRALLQSLLEFAGLHGA